MCVRSLVKTTNHACSYPSEFGGFLSLVVSIFCGWAGLFAAVDAVSVFGVAVALVVLSKAVAGAGAVAGGGAGVVAAGACVAVEVVVVSVVPVAGCVFAAA